MAQAGGTGGVVAALLLGFKTYETRKAERNGGTVSYRLQSVEGELSEANQKLNVLHREFCEFREEMRLRNMREDTLREVRNG